jgi:hypothetical protein
MGLLVLQGARDQSIGIDKVARELLLNPRETVEAGCRRKKGIAVKTLANALENRGDRRLNRRRYSLLETGK